LKLAKGVSAFDTCSQELFKLRAYLIVAFGDIPAVSMLMRMKGHNGFSPCRMCNITGLRVPHGATTNYIPLDRSQHPSVKGQVGAVQIFDAEDLPLRSHKQIMAQAHEVQFAKDQTTADRLSRQYGINGISIFSSLHSMRFPTSFPYDFMHLIFENVLKALVLHWTGNFKGLDSGTEDYTLQPKVWEAIGKATAESGSTIPSAFGARPPNIADDKTSTTADSWSFWMLYLGPILLCRRFAKEEYFTHFVELSKLVHLCLKFELSRSEIDEIRVGFQKWVRDYERYVMSRYIFTRLQC
jgi:hypothetical protein